MHIVVRSFVSLNVIICTQAIYLYLNEISEVKMAEEPQAPPTADVSYPLNVQYCGACTMPLEYCEYSSCKEKCREWLEKNLPNLAGELSVTEGETTSDEKKHQVSVLPSYKTH